MINKKSRFIRFFVTLKRAGVAQWANPIPHRPAPNVGRDAIGSNPHAPIVGQRVTRDVGPRGEISIQGTWPG